VGVERVFVGVGRQEREGQTRRRGQEVQCGFFGRQMRAPSSMRAWLCIPGFLLGTIKAARDWSWVEEGEQRFLA
jgi:hypothetical protein